MAEEGDAECTAAEAESPPTHPTNTANSSHLFSIASSLLRLSFHCTRGNKNFINNLLSGVVFCIHLPSMHEKIRFATFQKILFYPLTF